MAQALASPKLRSELREYLVREKTLAIIDTEFSNAGIRRDEDYDPPESGERRQRIEQYFRTLDFANASDVAKLLIVLESVLFDLEHDDNDESPKQVQRFVSLLQRDGYSYEDYRIATPDRPTPPLIPAKGLYAFISYSTHDKVVAGETQEALKRYGIRSFLAHENLRVSDEWKARIFEELQKANLFVALLSKHFTSSTWTAQEVGIAYAQQRYVFIPISLDDTHSYGFISHVQSEPLRGRPIDDVLLHPMLTKYPERVFPKLVDTVRNAGSFRHAESVMKPIVQYFHLMPSNTANEFAQACIDNGQVWSAQLCRTQYIPEFLEIHAENLDAKTKDTLEYQLENNAWFPHERG